MENNNQYRQEGEDQPDRVSYVNPVAPPINQAWGKLSAKEVVLQSISYVSWYWLIIVIWIVLYSCLSDYLAGSNGDYDWITVLLPQAITLLPLAIISDRYYKKIEEPSKHGISALFMIIAALLSFVLAVGAIITIFTSLISLINDVNSPAENGNIIATLITSISVAFLSVFLFLRIMYFERFTRVRDNFWMIVSVVFAITMIATITGPLTRSVIGKTDRLIDKNYYSLTAAIDDYISKNNKLPNDLSDINFKQDAKKAIDTGKITYRKLPPDSKTYNSNSAYSSYEDKTVFNYEICVNWRYAIGEKPSTNAELFSSNYHDQGKQCYKEGHTGY